MRGSQQLAPLTAPVLRRAGGQHRGPFELGEGEEGRRAHLLVARVGVKGGETRVFDADGPAGQRFTLAEPWSALLLDDARVIHETTPIQPLDAARGGYRDTLVITLRAGAFQGP